MGSLADKSIARCLKAILSFVPCFEQFFFGIVSSSRPNLNKFQRFDRKIWKYKIKLIKVER